MKAEVSIHLVMLPVWQQEDLRAGHRKKSQPSCHYTRSMRLGLAWEPGNLYFFFQVTNIENRASRTKTN